VIIFLCVIFCLAGLGSVGFHFYNFKIDLMRDTLFGILANLHMEQANVLDTLPDSIFITGKTKLSYLND
jgi:hypothetical protein